MKIKQNSFCSGGFTFIEILIVIAIIGIMSAVAIPSYNNHMLDTRRVDGIKFLNEVAGEQTRFASENNRFATTMAELGYGEEATALSDEGYYTLSISTSDLNQVYVLKAIPVATGPQAKDTECAILTLNSSQQKTVSGSGSVDSCW